MIESAQYTNEEQTSVSVTYDDGKILSVPVAQGNRHYQELMEWLEQGNTIQSYVAPTPPPKTRFSSREFLKRLSPQQRIEMKTHSDPTVQLWYDDLIAADFVDVEHQDTIDAVSYGLSIGFLTQAEADALLAPETVE